MKQFEVSLLYYVNSRGAVPLLEHEIVVGKVEHLEMVVERLEVVVRPALEIGNFLQKIDFVLLFVLADHEERNEVLGVDAGKGAYGQGGDCSSSFAFGI